VVSVSPGGEFYNPVTLLLEHEASEQIVFMIFCVQTEQIILPTAKIG